MGWNATFDVCNWTGVYCFNSSGVGRVYWMCAPPASSLPTLGSPASTAHISRSFQNWCWALASSSCSKL